MTPLGQEEHKQTEKDPEGIVLRIMRKKGEKEVNFLPIKIKGRSHQDHPILATEERFLVFSLSEKGCPMEYLTPLIYINYCLGLLSLVSYQIVVFIEF